MSVLDRFHGLALLLPLACAAESGTPEAGPACRGAKCDAASGTSECDVVNRSGAGGALADVLNHNDPLANAIFKSGETCPSSYAELVEKLDKFDNENCSMRTAAVSETAQVRGEATSYRTVTTRDCDGRSTHGMLFSLFGLGAGTSQLPASAEVISFDPVAGVFNYYDLAGGSWTFHGNSKQLADGSDARCAECHTGGGLIMKELDAPWLHWEGDTTTPGASELVDNNNDLGELTDGIEVEEIVRNGNSAWLKTRMQHMLEKGDVQALLEPLFCTVEFNIVSGTSSPDGSIFEIPSGLLADNALAFVSPNMDDELYRAAIEKSGQVISDRNGLPLTDASGNKVVDSHFPFSFPARADADQEYVENLVNLGVIDEEFRADVLAIDFTRPIFSDDRCDLKRFAPDIAQLLAPPAEDGAEGPDVGDCCTAREGDPGCSIEAIETCVCDADDFCCDDSFDDACVEHLTSADDPGFDGECTQFATICDGQAGGGTKLVDGLSKQIREGFIANLQAQDARPESPEGQLLLALTSQDDGAQGERAQAFGIACNSRDQAEFMDDVLAVVSQRRNEARTHGVMEFAETLPHDNLDTSVGLRMHPLTCELTNEYVGHITEAPPAPENCLQIAEVFYDVAGTGDDGKEWIKIYNSCGDTQSLEGHSLAWGGKDYLVGGIDLAGDISGKSCMIIGGPVSDETNGTPAVDINDKLTPNLQNSGAEADGVAIFNVVEDDVTASTVPLDAVIYGGSNDNNLLDARGDSPEPHVGDADAGSSIIRSDRASWTISDAPAPADCPDF